jgi:hypothetical protein
MKLNKICSFTSSLEVEILLPTYDGNKITILEILLNTEFSFHKVAYSRYEVPSEML